MALGGFHFMAGEAFGGVIVPLEITVRMPNPESRRKKDGLRRVGNPIESRKQLPVQRAVLDCLQDVRRAATTRTRMVVDFSPVLVADESSRKFTTLLPALLFFGVISPVPGDVEEEE